MQRERPLFRHVMERVGIGQTVTLAMNSFSFHSGGTAPDIVMFFAFQLKRRIVAQKSEGSDKIAKNSRAYYRCKLLFVNTRQSGHPRCLANSLHVQLQGRNQGNHNMQNLDVNS